MLNIIVESEKMRRPMKWYSPLEKVPPQGKKIIWFKEGDCQVVQKFGDYWIPIPFTDSKYAKTDCPDLWADIQMPGEYTGKLHVMFQGEFCDIDTFEKENPEAYTEFVSAFLRKE